MPLDTNLSAYRSGRIVKEYAHADAELTLQEKLCLECVPEARGGSVLDIGIGAGRTVGPLSQLFGSYVGIDYSEPMISTARMRFPMHDLRVMDARRLEFPDQFDCVFFSYNGIDYIGFADRCRALRSIFNALRPGGIFIFSTHNLRHRRVRSWLNDLFVQEIAPIGLTMTWADARAMLMRTINFWRQQENRELGFAYINDPAHRFSIITMYVDIERQKGALKQMGFVVLATIGNTKTTNHFDERDCWVYIVAQRR
jgi:ubiquinone/menaquinone biosynthesis C-methylase UbiE